jgi:hypothetical protein
VGVGVGVAVFCLPIQLTVTYCIDLFRA